MSNIYHGMTFCCHSISNSHTFPGNISNPGQVHKKMYLYVLLLVLLKLIIEYQKDKYLINPNLFQQFNNFIAFLIFCNVKRSFSGTVL